MITKHPKITQYFTRKRLQKISTSPNGSPTAQVSDDITAQTTPTALYTSQTELSSTSQQQRHNTQNSHEFASTSDSDLWLLLH